MRKSLPQPTSKGGLSVPTFFNEEDDDEVESMGLLNAVGGSDGDGGANRGIAYFEIDQARQGSKRRRRDGSGRGRRVVSFCAGFGCLHWSLTFSVMVNLGGLIFLFVQLVSNGRSLGISNGFRPTRGFAASNHSNIIYGHVHIVKTAGTAINGLLASTYDNVCGSKGYSLDYYEYNERVRNSTHHDVRNVVMDSVSNQANDPMMNRGRLPFDIVQEIGFQNCDYVSLEYSWEIWPQLRQTIPKRYQLELHVPCRDPLDHLMSMCLDKNWDFDCRSNDLEAEIEACVFGMDRFSLQLTTLPNVEVKCFAPIPLEPYIEYMHPFLQARRIPAVYVDRDSNGAGGPRDEIIKGGECLGWYPHIADQVQTMLLEKYEFYQWCDECLGLSANDLLF